jgi:hypothetical protein
MAQIRLTALKSGLPIGFMAALGTFRQATHMPELGTVELAWTPHAGQWCAVLHMSEPVEPEIFVKLLLDRVKASGDRPEFQWSDAIKTRSREEFAKGARPAIEAASAADHELADWFAAYCSELALKNETDKVESTPLDMTVARQQFLADAAWLTTSLATPDKKAGDALNIASFRETLFGPWRYSENQHSLGWDPSTILMGAFTPKAPTAMNKAGVRGAVWLAMESLPFFPCVYQDGRLATRAFVRQKRRLTFQWPIWAQPLSRLAVQTLLSQVPEMKPEEWKARGIAGVYSSEVYKPNKYLSSFQPAVLLG